MQKHIAQQSPGPGYKGGQVGGNGQPIQQSRFRHGLKQIKKQSKNTQYQKHTNVEKHQLMQHTALFVLTDVVPHFESLIAIITKLTKKCSFIAKISTIIFLEKILSLPFPVQNQEYAKQHASQMGKVCHIIGRIVRKS
jgi:hypothetical protein